MTSLSRGIARDFHLSWKSLVLTDILYRVVAFIVLTPLVGGMFRLFIATSGSVVLSDADILFFFIGPVGWICAIVVGAFWVSIIGFEQASLLAILGARSARQVFGPVGAIRFAAANAGPVIRVTARIVTLSLLATIPFLAIASLIYLSFLTKYDINYYLTEKPPVFLMAIGIAVVLVISLTALLLRLFTGWFFALPIVLFEDVSPRDALRLSVARAHGHRRTLLAWIVGWAVMMLAFSVLTTGMVGLAGRLLIPGSDGSMRLVTLAIGVVVLLLFVVNLAVNLFGTTTFAAILFTLYRQFGSDGSSATLLPDITDATSGKTYLRITLVRLLVTSAAGVAIAAIIGIAVLLSVRVEDRVQIMAHRGSSKAAPENTLAAFQRAIEDGADWIELDVQETADGEIVVMHDSDFMKLAKQDLKIWDARTEDLKDIDVGSWFASEFDDQRVPTLAEVLDECKGKIGVNIELKYYGHDDQLEQRVADIVQARGMESEVMAMSLKMDGVRKMKSICPHWKVGVLMSVSAGDLAKMDADFLAINARFANRQLIRSAHDSGLKVYVWTVNDAATMSVMISRGVDGLLTDDPALARSVLEQRVDMSVPERLLLELTTLLGATPEIAGQ